VLGTTLHHADSNLPSQGSFYRGDMSDNSFYPRRAILTSTLSKSWHHSYDVYSPQTRVHLCNA